MVLCKFYQQGACRFGSKCHNEHFDIKQVVKTDVEASINGKQWPFSCYGPFKDKPCLPNFIEDQSFEEIRLMCYEAKQKNYFEQFHQQFLKEAMDVNSKMKALLQFTPEIVNVICKVYDVAVETIATKSNNPFGLGGNVGAVNTSSLFAKPVLGPSTSMFGTGSGANATNSFAVSNTNGSIFGGTATNLSTGNNIFGGQTQTSIFGQSNKSSNSIFGGGNASNQNQGSLFSQTQPIAGSGNVFNQQQTQQSSPGFALFGQAAQQSVQGSSFFNQSQPSQPTTSVFGQALAPQQQNTNPFTQAANQSGQTLFASQSNSGQNLFTQAVQQQPMQPIAGQTGFTQPNIFGQTIQQQQPVQNNAPFMQSATLSQQQQQQQQTLGPFQQVVTQTSEQQMAPQPLGTSVYSRLEDLTAEEIEAFKADSFLPGKIPFNPPPRELIN
uniref:Nucleoporin NUP42 n=1 Tax=Glossina morsitans morsitans TaxID=37546 RepID=D3TLW5_GLOMM